ncbi:hypothetical protein F4815DRAFT_442690 [Daldinia loculata]|nr:hypothetical protein F4815DRAFT_442690 [Daldinia loculata]
MVPGFIRARRAARITLKIGANPHTLIDLMYPGYTIYVVLQGLSTGHEDLLMRSECLKFRQAGQPQFPIPYVIGHDRIPEPSTRSRLNLAKSAPVQYSQSRAQNNQSSWTAADAAKASKNGAFLTAWPPEEPYHTPTVDLFGQGQNQNGSRRS